MDDRNYGPADGNMDLSGRHFGDGPPRDDAPGPADDFDLAAFTRSLDGDAAGFGVWSIIAGGVLVALTVLAFVYGWPLWTVIPCILGLVVMGVVGMLRRPPVAPLELTAVERERVRRVLDEHGARAAVALVRALYPDESSVAATKTVRLLLERS